jgi:predicted transcriptional regulator
MESIVLFNVTFPQINITDEGELSVTDEGIRYLSAI